MNNEQPKNVYQARRKKLAAAIERWEDEVPREERLDPSGASLLEDAFRDEGLILLPRSTGHGKWRVLVDGRAAPLPGSDTPAGPLDAEEAADAFLTQTVADERNAHQILIRPATDLELRYSAVMGSNAVDRDVTRLVPSRYEVVRHEGTGRTELKITASDGRVLVVDLDTGGDSILAGALGFERKRANPAGGAA